MITLTRYLSLKLFWSALGVSLVFTALVQILDLLDATEDILKIGAGAGGFAFYILMRLPSIIPEIMPLSILVASLFTLAVLVRNGEVVCLQAAGMTIARIIAAMVPAVLVLALAHYAISDTLRPSAERRLIAWWAENAAETGGGAQAPVWMKVGGTVIMIERVRERGRRLEGLHIYDRDEGGTVVLRTVAGLARYSKGGWVLKNAVATDWRREHLNQTRPAAGSWTTQLRPGDVLEAMMPEARVSASAARAVLSGERLSINARSVYATALQRAFAEPLSNLVMLLLAAPVAAAHYRGSQASRSFLLALGIGLVFLLADGITATLGSAGVIQPILAAWAPSVLFGILAIVFVRRLERP